MSAHANRTIFYRLILTLLSLTLVAQSEAGTAPQKKGIISATELHALLEDRGNPRKLVIIEVGWGGPEDYYNKGHIPGSIHVNTDEIEYDLFNARDKTTLKKLGRSTSEREDQVKGLSAQDSLERNWWNIYPDHYLLPALADMGVQTNTMAVLYAKDITAAARLAWTMLYAGVHDVYLLDGGLTAWKKAGYPAVKEPSKRQPVANFGATTALHPEYKVDVAFVRSVIDNPNIALADIRTEDEYKGLSAPYSYIPSKGRIKGAHWGHAGKGPWTMDYYVNDDGTLRAPKEVEIMWATNGITRDKHAIFYCGTAWRASLAFWFGYMLDWPEISNFDGSWYKWSLGPEKDLNPVE